MGSHDVSRPAFRRTVLPVGAFVAGVALLVSACTSGSNGSGTRASGNPASDPAGSSAPASPTTSSSAPAGPLELTATPTGHKNVNPTTPITVTAANGTLRSVTLVNAAGKSVTGEYSTDHASWHATEVLGYGKTYHLAAKATLELLVGAPGHVLDRGAVAKPLG